MCYLLKHHNVNTHFLQFIILEEAVSNLSYILAGPVRQTRTAPSRAAAINYPVALAGIFACDCLFSDNYLITPTCFIKSAQHYRLRPRSMRWRRALGRSESSEKAATRCRWCHCGQPPDGSRGVCAEGFWVLKKPMFSHPSVITQMPRIFGHFLQSTVDDKNKMVLCVAEPLIKLEIEVCNYKKQH